MSLPTFALLFAGLAAADSMASYRECAIAGVQCSSYRAVWFTDYDAQDINANNGCRQGAPGMTQFCVDWHSSPWRGHFYYAGQGKRCFAHKLRKRNARMSESLLCGTNLGT